MKAVVAAFNQEKALVGAFYVITNLWMELFQALAFSIVLCSPETSSTVALVLLYLKREGPVICYLLSAVSCLPHYCLFVMNDSVVETPLTKAE